METRRPPQEIEYLLRKTKAATCIKLLRTGHLKGKKKLRV